MLEADLKGQQGGHRHVGVCALERRHVQGTLSAAWEVLVSGTKGRSGQGGHVAGGRTMSWAGRQWRQHLRCVAQEMLRWRGFRPEHHGLLSGIMHGLCLRLANLGKCETVGVGVVGGRRSGIRPGVTAVFRATPGLGVPRALGVGTVGHGLADVSE